MRSPQETQITSLNISNLTCNNQPPMKSNLIITSYCDQHCFVIHHTRWEQPVTRIRCRVCMYKCIGEQQGSQKWLSPCSNYHTISQEVLPSRREVPCLSLFRVISMRPRPLSNCHRDEGIWGVRSINFCEEQRVEEYWFSRQWKPQWGLYLWKWWWIARFSFYLRASLEPYCYGINAGAEVNLSGCIFQFLWKGFRKMSEALLFEVIPTYVIIYRYHHRHKIFNQILITYNCRRKAVDWDPWILDK